MFCSKCGYFMREEFIFCTNCGKEILTKEAPAASTVPKPTAAPTLNEYLGKKKLERSSHFKNKKAKKEPNSEVTINIGLMRYADGEDKLKVLRGKTLPLKVNKLARSADILKLGLTKVSCHHKSDVLDISNVRDCKLMYPDGTVVNNLKESETEFILEAYRKELGRPYNRITLYICSNADHMDFLRASFSEECDEEQSDSEHHFAIDVNNSRTTSSITPTTAITSAVHPTFPETPSSSGRSLLQKAAVPGCSEITCDQSEIPGYKAIQDIFQHLPKSQIMCALLKCNNDVEATVNLLLSENKREYSSQDSYASIVYCDDANENDEGDLAMPGEYPEPTCMEPQSVSEKTSLQSNLKEMGSCVLGTGAEIRLLIRRSHVWEDALSKLRRVQDFSGRKVKVRTFIGEPAVDEGGPRKEFFHLVHTHMQESALLTGPPECRSFAHNIIALEQRECYYYGVICSL